MTTRPHTPQDLTLSHVTSVHDWLPRELPSCTGLTALRLHYCNSSQYPRGEYAVAGTFPDQLPDGPYLRNLVQLSLVFCHFLEVPPALSAATALRLLTFENDEIGRLQSLPRAPFRAAQAGQVLAGMRRLRELRLRTRNWEADEQRRLKALLPDVSICYTGR